MPNDKLFKDSKSEDLWTKDTNYFDQEVLCKIQNPKRTVYQKFKLPTLVAAAIFTLIWLGKNNQSQTDTNEELYQFVYDVTYEALNDQEENDFLNDDFNF